MQLSVQERFALLNLLPSQGDFTTLRVVRELREELSFNDEEHQALQFKWATDDRVTWESDNDPMKDFDLGWKQEEVIRTALQKADKEKKLTMEHFSVYEKFIQSEEPEKITRINKAAH